jgi:hypothetical protein
MRYVLTFIHEFSKRKKGYIKLHTELVLNMLRLSKLFGKLYSKHFTFAMQWGRYYESTNLVFNKIN